MLFHSQAFILAFFPAVLALYYALAGRIVAREWLIISASAFFYGWWDVRFLPLLVGQVAAGWLFAELYFRTHIRFALTAGVIVNLVLLGVFKYLDFFTGILDGLFGVQLGPTGIILPIGISFFTFQIISYLVDVRRGEVPRYAFRRFAVVIMLFPHLIAGPIVRHVELVPQLDADPRRDGMAERISRGLALFIVGFLTKVLVADRIAPTVDTIFTDATPGGAGVGFLDGWLGATGFALQIYLDFGAYSEMAIGLALTLGLNFPINFNLPYRATSLRDFWRRWHMSLSRFLRDYLYIPLGGSREGFGQFALATLTTMGLCGLWHGAGWTFVIWGLLHGVGLIVCRAWQVRGIPLPAPVGWALTFLFAVAVFVPFRAPSLDVALEMLKGMSGINGQGEAASLLGRPTQLALLAAVVLSFIRWPATEIVTRYLKPNPALAILGAIAAFWGVLEVGRGQPASFIYFQF